MIPFVMDANALIAYLTGEVGGDVVESIMMDSDNVCLMHAVNLCEVYYEYVKNRGLAEAMAVTSDLVDTGLMIREDMDEEFWQQAGNIKAKYSRISLADCFCITLAGRLNAEVVTADHHTFDAIAGIGDYKIKFIR